MLISVMLVFTSHQKTRQAWYEYEGGAVERGTCKKIVFLAQEQEPSRAGNWVLHCSYRSESPRLQVHVFSVSVALSLRHWIPLRSMTDTKRLCSLCIGWENNIWIKLKTFSQPNVMTSEQQGFFFRRSFRRIFFFLLMNCDPRFYSVYYYLLRSILFSQKHFKTGSNLSPHWTIMAVQPTPWEVLYIPIFLCSSLSWWRLHSF